MYHIPLLSLNMLRTIYRQRLVCNKALVRLLPQRHTVQAFSPFCSKPSSNNNDDQVQPPRSMKNFFFRDVQKETEKHVEVEEAVSQDDSYLEDKASWNTILTTNYENFDAVGSKIIYDVTEEELGLANSQPAPPPVIQEFVPVISLERGKTGVFDLEDLIDLLKSENAKDIVVLKIPAEARFVAHMVVVSAMTQRHIDAICSSIRFYYNKKVTRKDGPLNMEGRFSPWVAMDLGNIAVHIMSPAERERVDIESLWACGPEHDLMLQETLQKALSSSNSHRAELSEEDFFLTELPTVPDNEEKFDPTKELIHPFCPVYEDDQVPLYSEINDSNRNTFPATTLMEIALAQHNPNYERKFRGRFKK